MKIIECYIENFGKLHHQHFDFNNNFNEIIEDNGWGKTTLSIFIKSMFYGLISKSNKYINENERKKYSPWQGGNFGGYIDFENKQGTFRIERFFGKKESEDTFNLIDLKSGKESNKYSKNIGNELFELDNDSFERCLFIPQKEITNGINDNISSKLINMVQGTNSSDSYENAIKILAEKKSDLNKNSKNSKLAKIKSEIENINNKINILKNNEINISLLKNKITQLNNKIAELEHQKQVIDNNITEYGKQQTIIANNRYIENTENKLYFLRKNINECNKILNNKNISNESLNNQIQNYNEYVTLTTKLSTLENTNNLKERHIELTKVLTSTPPLKEEIDNIIAKEKAVKQNELSQNSTSTIMNNKFNSQLVLIPLFILSIICGLVVTFIKPIISIPFFVIAIISLIVSGFLHLRKIIEIKTSSINIKPQQNDSKINQYKIEINEFISKFSNEKINDNLEFLYNLNTKLNEFENLKNEIEKYNSVILQLNNDIKNKLTLTNNFLNQFNYNNINLNTNEKFKLIQETVANKINYLQQIEELDADLLNFKKENNLTETIKTNEFENVNINDLQNTQSNIQLQIDEYKEEKNNLVNNIDSIQNEIFELNELENELELLNTKKINLENQVNIINLTNDYLTKANNNLTNKYKIPMENELNKYLKIVLNDNYYKFDLDTDLNVSFNEYGKSKELDFLSKGYQGIIDFCIRLSLVNILFPNEKPFLILDDPFVNYDDKKLNTALNLIKEITKDYQIIYFVCHKSRS